MNAYFDTSALVKLLVDEAGSETVRSIRDGIGPLASSVLVYPESAAALAAARRSGRLGHEAHRHARLGLERLWATLIPVECSIGVIRDAAQLAELEALRGCDAVHLASALSIGDEELLFVCFDADLAEAARRNGLAVTG
jgi:predicted nucleic acid-binding protein